MEYYTARTKNRHLTHLVFAKEAGPNGGTPCVIRLMESSKLGKTNARWEMSEWVSPGRRTGRGPVPERQDVLGLGLINGHTGVCMIAKTLVQLHADACHFTDP